ncbi:hypothetical protein AGMMS49944_24130 [Spirochaetia bacterium]|nr:hypothetical protein AGMMS49944_24130 [Spirochaetia bacterium]
MSTTDTEVELRISADIAKAKAGIVELGKSFDVLYKETKQYESELDKIDALAKAGIITQKEAAAQKQAADKKHLEALKDQYAEQVKLNGATSEQAKAIEKNIKEMQSMEESVHSVEEQSKKVGDVFSKFIPGSIKNAGAAFKELNKLIDMKAQAAGATTFGTAFKTIVTGGIKSAATAMKALWAATGPIGLAIGAIVAVVVLLTKGISGAVKAQKEYNENTKAGLDAMDALKRTVDGVATSQDNATKKTLEGEKAAMAQKMVWEAIGNWFSDTFGPVIDWITDKFKVVQNLVGFIASKLGLVTDEAVELRVEFSKTVEQAKAISSAEQQYADQMAAINLDSKKGAQDKLSAAQGYLDALAAQYVQVVKNVGAESQMAKQIKSAIDAQSKLRDEFAKQADTQGKASKVVLGEVEKRKKIEEDIKKQLNEINVAYQNESKHMKDAGASEEELARLTSERDKQLKGIYQIGVSQLDLLAAEYKVNEQMSPNLYKQREAWADSRDAIKEIVSYSKEQQALINEITDALAEQAIEEEKTTDTRIKMEQELIDIQRARAREALENEKAFQELTKESQADVLAKFDAVTEGMKSALELNEIEKLNLEIAEAEAAYREKEAAAQIKLNAGKLTQKEYEEQIKAAAEEHNKIVQGLATEYAGVEGAADALAGSLKNVEKEATTTEKALAGLQAANRIGDAASGLVNQLAGNRAKEQSEAVKKELEATNEIIKTELEHNK